MAADASGLDLLLAQWRQFTVGDRKAIIARLSPEQRHELQRLTFEGGAPGAAEPPPNHRFRAYSGWLAALIESCESDAPSATPLKPAARAELLAAHQLAAAQAKGGDGKASLPDLARSLVQSVRAFL